MGGHSGIVERGGSVQPFPCAGLQLALPETTRTIEHDPSLEIIFTVVSIGVSLAGIGLAWLFYVRRPELGEQTAVSLGGLYRLVLNKYYVDEIYRFLIVRPLVVGSEEVLWKGVDQVAIDGTVNLAARRTRRVGDTLRRIQSGNIRSYAAWVALGAVLLICFMVAVAA